MHRWLSIVVLLFAIWPLTAAHGTDEPGSAAILNYLKQRLPDYIQVSKFEFKNFKGPSEGTGRSSVYGRLALSQDLFLPAPNALQAILIAEGWSEREIYFHARTIGMEAVLDRVYRVDLPKGLLLEFSAELGFMATVRGLQFAGDIRYARLAGSPRRELPPGAVIAGSTQFEKTLVDLRNTKAELNNLQERAISSVEGIFFNGPFNYVITRDGADENMFSLKVADGVSWNILGQDLEAGVMEYSLMAESQWPEGGRWANSRYQSGAQVPMLLHGETRLDPKSKTWRVSLTISVPEENNGGFYNTGQHLAWNGQMFESADWLAGRLVPQSATVRPADSPARAVFSALEPGSTLQVTAQPVEINTRSRGIVELTIASITIGDDELIINLRANNPNPEEQYLIYVTSNDDLYYGEKIFIMDNLDQKFYAKDGLEGSGRSKKFNSSANAYYLKAQSTDIIHLRFPMISKGANTIGLFSRTVHGHQDAWWVKDLWFPQK